MSARPLVLAAVTLLLLASSAGCARRGYVIPGPDAQPARLPMVPADGDVSMARARPRPTLEVHPADALDAEPAALSVVSHRAGSPPSLRELRLERIDGRELTVVYTPPGDLPLPVDPGDAVLVQLLPPDPESAYRGPALIVRDRAGRLVAALAAGGGLPAGALGAELDLGASGRMVYSDARQLPSLCTVATLHFRLRVRERDSFRYVPPGTESTLRVDGHPFRLLALDASRPADGRCGDEARPELSFALLALPDDGRGARGEGAVEGQPPSPRSP
ncbi:MAG: hypothetical protein H6746_10695 [Deltaproteobacteria bacterium]|nr:hypothetical protein [Deltaproteobacteria bacterium]